MAAAVQPEVLDLRHFSADTLRPLLEEESRSWGQVLRWDYRNSVELLLGYFNAHMLPGYAAVENGRCVGYAFAVYEGNKAVIGDVYASHLAAPGTEHRLLRHLIETLQASPGISRIESQLLLHRAGELRPVFESAGFTAWRRLMLEAELAPGTLPHSPDAPQRWDGQLRLRRWEENDFARAAQLIFNCYHNHIDAAINQQYRSVAGAQRFLHNIVRFPGCGFFDAPASRVAQDPKTGALAAMVLCSRVAENVAHITQLCVSPEHRRQGLGLALLEACEARLRYDGFSGVTLTVTEDNIEAVEFYRREGFRQRHVFEAYTWDAR